MIKTKDDGETKKRAELLFEDTESLVSYIGKIKKNDIDNDNYVITLYKKGLVYKKLRRIGVSDSSEIKIINYREIVQY